MKKKLLSLLLVGLLILGLTGCGDVESNDLNKTDESEIINTTYHEVTFSELIKMIEDKETFVLVIGSETCNACVPYKSTMEKIITEYNIRINYINVFPLQDEEITKLRSYIYYSAIPITAFFENGVAGQTYNQIRGNESYDKVVEMLKKNGYIK